MNLAEKGLNAKSSNSLGCHEANRIVCPVPERGTLGKSGLYGGCQERGKLVSKWMR